MQAMETYKMALAQDTDQTVNSIIGDVDSFVRKQYLSELKNARIAPLDARLLPLGIGRNARLFKVAAFACGSADSVDRRLANICSAISGLKGRQIFILDSDGYEISLYMGIACDQIDRLSMQFETFKGSFLGNFPGARLSVLNAGNNKELLENIFDEKGIHIASVSSLAGACPKPQAVGYGIEYLIDGMYGKPFTMVFIAESAPKPEVVFLKQSLEAMHTQLSPYKSYVLSVSDGESKSVGESFGLTMNESVTEGTTMTENATLGKSKTTSVSTQMVSEDRVNGAKNQLIGTAISLASIMTGVGAAGTVGLLPGLFYGSSISNVLNSAQVLALGAQNPETETSGTGESYSLGYSTAETSSVQKGFSSSKGVSETNTKSGGKSIQMSYENMSVKNLLALLEQQIDRLTCIEGSQGLNCAAYFVAGDYTTALMVANMYRSLFENTGAAGQGSVINVWSARDEVEHLGMYLKRLCHPVFHFEAKPSYPTFTAASLISPEEIPIYISLPQKSVLGLPVTTYAEFSRIAMGRETMAGDGIEIGNIFHMGKTQIQKLYISKSALRGHLFVAGTTGMGKSNFCYGLLYELYRSRVKFMVIEPAKGEYCHVFGGLKDVHVFGTNPNLMPLLKINPFAFPQGIHVNEHIDRLLEIFNSCWPMYAAMPAVLKEGMERAYRQCGYNLVTGKCRQDGRFPTFTDLLKVLPEVIRKSEFSGEVKGNYIGSLVTRISSLTDGLYGCIFSGDEIDPAVLFDENVLIDLSRIGSGETKALIMGLLVMKLQEFRMSASKMNVPLSHVTLLEEAHHLLRRGTGATAEGVNLRAMSLEMITNAIAEMRTYGEGFVIADQSPSVMDPAVLRNTNTKVIFKLPEYSDRQAAGTAMALDPGQINELSKLECGVAAVFQSNWSSAVLAKIRYYDTENFRPFVSAIQIPEINEDQIRHQCLAILLRHRLRGSKKSSVDRAVCEEILKNSEYVDTELKPFMKIIEKYLEADELQLSFSELCRQTDRILDSRKLTASCGSTADIHRWYEQASDYVRSLAILTDDEVNESILLCLNIRANASKEYRQVYYRALAYINTEKNQVSAKT